MALPDIKPEDVEILNSIPNTAKKKGLTLDRFFDKLGELLDATEQKAKWAKTKNKKGGNWQYSKKMKALGTQTKATEMLGNVYGVFKQQLDVNVNGPITVEIIDRFEVSK